jgi:hypothetical protein
MIRARRSAGYLAIAAAILFLLNPLVHLHYQPAAGPEGSVTARNITSSGCAACLLHGGAAAAVNISAFESLELSAPNEQPQSPLHHSVDPHHAVASRAPPSLAA